MKIEGILFDLDNTLVDRYKSLIRVIDIFKEYFIKELVDINVEELQNIIVKADSDGYRDKVDIFNDILEAPIWLRRPSIDELFMFWNAEFGRCTEPVKGMYDVLEYFFERKIKMGIITNGSVHRQNYKIDCIGIRKYMSTIIISDEVGIKKPDPRIFERALIELKLKPENVIYVGDNPKLDVIGSGKAGLTPIWISWGRRWEEEGVKPVLVAEELEELVYARGSNIMF